MLNNPHRCVIDRDGHYVTFVLLEEQHDGSSIPYAYTLRPGEALIEAVPPSGILKPRWTGSVWEETATPEEVEAVMLERQKETAGDQSVPSLEERLQATEDAILSLALGGETDV